MVLRHGHNKQTNKQKGSRTDSCVILTLASEIGWGKPCEGTKRGQCLSFPRFKHTKIQIQILHLQ